MTHAQREAYVEKVGKSIRKELYIAGHDYVTSTISYPSKGDLNDYFSADKYYEDYLDQEQISQIYKCFHSKICRVYYISTSSEYWGGYGIEGAYVLLDIKKRTHKRLIHSVYAE